MHDVAKLAGVSPIGVELDNRVLSPHQRTTDIDPLPVRDRFDLCAQIYARDETGKRQGEVLSVQIHCMSGAKPSILWHRR